MTTLHSLKATLMRGGTSKGLFFRADSLPADTETRDRLLLRALGSPDPHGLQIDGLGTGISSTSKIVILSPSQRPDCDVDYLFGHVAIGEPLIDWSGNCGNLTAAVPLFAVASGLVAPDKDGPFTVHIWQANIGKRIHAEIDIERGQAVWHGDYRIDGVAFPGAPIRLHFLDPAGGGAGTLFPTGNPCDTLHLPDGTTLAATLIDAGNPTVFVRAADLGLSGYETAAHLDAKLHQTLEWARAAGAVAMGLAPDITSASRERPATPKISFLSPARATGYDLNGRILSMGRLHHAFTGTGAIALAAACAIDGTLASEMAGGVIRGRELNFSHASGGQALEARVSRNGDTWQVDEVVMTRTARPLMSGEVWVPLD
ncbi:AcnD-accessory protein PrpF [Pseudogulbenkiania sp. NH8B]|uniref:2-methylaconitate cis-trans isomerase PrpF family protein n=1 Tax=Pseudogulbenkiania sp. (strain NH8B) TaxID=748280 RepID=UPI0002279E03|nr:PrpF domain-containing protein [Pseudogulbenkiania sp. NH8B]BAK77112.1 AcnD-accessory protein PrpF [Pseudogulbenkiania sp. NH8B]